MNVSTQGPDDGESQVGKYYLIRVANLFAIVEIDSFLV